jgi:hypothetical protein
VLAFPNAVSEAASIFVLEFTAGRFAVWTNSSAAANISFAVGAALDLEGGAAQKFGEAAGVASADVGRCWQHLGMDGTELGEVCASSSGVVALAVRDEPRYLVPK